jgi:hypothetical protein
MEFREFVQGVSFKERPIGQQIKPTGRCFGVVPLAFKAPFSAPFRRAWRLPE